VSEVDSKTITSASRGGSGLQAWKETSALRSRAENFAQPIPR
jgi:hypothetical protein